MNTGFNMNCSHHLYIYTAVVTKIPRIIFICAVLLRQRCMYPSQPSKLVFLWICSVFSNHTIFPNYSDDTRWRLGIRISLCTRLPLPWTKADLRIHAFPPLGFELRQPLHKVAAFLINQPSSQSDCLDSREVQQRCVTFDSTQELVDQEASAPVSILTMISFWRRSARCILLTFAIWKSITKHVRCSVPR